MLLRGVIILATPNEICKKEKASEKTLIKKYYLFTFPNFQITQTNVGSLVILLMVMIILSKFDEWSNFNQELCICLASILLLSALLKPRRSNSEFEVNLTFH